MKNILVIFVFLIGFISCEKEPGEGGTSVIEGTVFYFRTSYNTQLGVMDTIYTPSVEKDVYIIYSSNVDDIYDDSFDTHWNGKYHFEYLRKGDYTIYTYKDSIEIIPSIPDSIEILHEYPVFRHVSIVKNHSSYTVNFILESND